MIYYPRMTGRGWYTLSEWNRENTRLYNVRILKKDPLCEALEKAADYEQVTPVRYIKQALADKLTREGFLTDYVTFNRPGRRPAKK